MEVDSSKDEMHHDDADSDAASKSEPPEERGRVSVALGWILRAAATTVAMMLLVWCVGMIYCLDDYGTAWLTRPLAILLLVAISMAWWTTRSDRRIGLGLILALFALCLMGRSLVRPSHDRDWGLPQQVLPTSELNADQDAVMIRNIRAFRYGPSESKTHYDDEYDLSKLKTVWFGVDRFTDVEPLAHTFLSFEFEPGNHRTNFLAFSVETRREKDELTYSPIRGIYNNYETIYVIADEQDVLSVRSDVREQIVQLYPVRATKAQAKAMLLDILSRVNDISERPEFYHTFTNNCTNNIVVHTNHVLEEPISTWERGVVFPGYSDWLAYQKGIIDTELPLAQAREKFRIDQRVKQFDGTQDFSEFIRGR